MSGSSTFGYAGRPMTDTVQKTGLSNIAAFGAQGGVRGTISGTASETNGGLGAEIGGDVELTAGEILTIVGGGQGASGGPGRDHGKDSHAILTHRPVHKSLALCTLRSIWVTY